MWTGSKHYIMKTGHFLGGFTSWQYLLLAVLGTLAATHVLNN